MRTLVTTLALLVASTAALAAEPGYLGVSVGTLDAETRARFDIPQDVEQGFVILEVMKDSAAERAGLRAGDVVTHLGGETATTVEGLVALVQKHKAGEALTYRLRRGTGTIEGTLTLGKRTDAPEAAAPAIERIEEATEVEPVPGMDADLEKRLDKVQGDIERLRKGLLEARARAEKVEKPVNLGTVEGWIVREERLALAAKRQGDDEAYRYHSIRLTVLREMRGSEVRLPERRLDRIERKLDAILDALRRK